VEATLMEITATILETATFIDTDDPWARYTLEDANGDPGLTIDLSKDAPAFSAGDYVRFMGVYRVASRANTAQ
jgi:hypothetical protein